MRPSSVVSFTQLVQRTSQFKPVINKYSFEPKSEGKQWIQTTEFLDGKDNPRVTEQECETFYWEQFVSTTPERCKI
jgi:hypothetical protein